MNVKVKVKGQGRQGQTFKNVLFQPAIRKDGSRSGHKGHGQRSRSKLQKKIPTQSASRSTIQNQGHKGQGQGQCQC